MTVTASKLSGFNRLLSLAFSRASFGKRLSKKDMLDFLRGQEIDVDESGWKDPSTHGNLEVARAQDLVRKKLGRYYLTKKGLSRAAKLYSRGD